MAQCEGPSSFVVDPFAFDWSDDSWKGLSLAGGCSVRVARRNRRPDGKFDEAKKRLGHLADLGVTARELIPLSVDTALPDGVIASRRLAPRLPRGPADL